MEHIKIYGITALIFFCMYIPIQLLTVSLTQDKKTHFFNKIPFSLADFLLLFVSPFWLITIIIVSGSKEETEYAIWILCFTNCGYIITSFNKGLRVMAINGMVFFNAIVLLLLRFLAHNLINNLPNRLLPTIDLLLFPILSYIFYYCFRFLFKILTKNHPITLDKHFTVGDFDEGYKRNATYADLIWTFCIMLGIPLLIFLILQRAQNLLH